MNRNFFGYLLLVSSALAMLATVPACADNRSLPKSWRAPKEAQQKTNPIPYTVDSVVKGKALFTEHCQACHGYWGEGNGVVGLSLDKRPANLLRIAGKKAEGEFAWKIAEGRGDMPSFRNKLTEDEIWNIVNFVESLENEEGGAVPVARQ